MYSFRAFLLEKGSEVGIQHSEHLADLSFDGEHPAKHALKTLKKVSAGKASLSRKIDDRMSYQTIRTPEGQVGVKYKGPGSHYNFSHDDIDKQHGHKPYLVHPLKALLSHLHKVLPQRPGEYQGGFMSTPETREHQDDHVSHTPNTITYTAHKDSPEAKKLAKSKVSTVIHTELKGLDRQAHPITDHDEFGSHSDVHHVSHAVTPDEAKILPGHKKDADKHLDAATKLMKHHTFGHLAGHETTMRTYINSTVDTGAKPDVEGYKKHLGAAHDKKIDAVKMQKSKDAKTETKKADMKHIDDNKEAFQRSFDIHHHLRQATNHLARSLNSTAHGGYKTTIGGNPSGGEGFMTGKHKVVDREEFAKANRARSAILKAGRTAK